MSTLPPGETTESLTKFIEDYWEDIALLAYNQYLDKGRGMVGYLWQENSFDNPNKLFYLTQEEIQINYDGNLPLVIAQYNPDETVVIGVIWQISLLQNQTYYIHYKKIPSPKMVYIQSRN